MDLKILWTDINTVNTTITIYRSDNPINTGSLPAPAATLPNGTTTWTDPNAVRGAYYYYLFKTESADDVVYSRNYRLQAVPRLGPGPSELKYGNYELGYFGSLTSLEFINATRLKELLDFTTPGTTGVNLVPTWHKFARNGKVYIVPQNCLSTVSVTWTQLYLAGLVYGTNDNGVTALGQTPTNQMRKITIGPDTFIVRCMRGYNDAADCITPATTAVDNDPILPPNEFSDFICPLSMYTAESQRLPNIVNQTMSQLFAGASNASTGSAICIEHVAANNRVQRRGYGTTDGRMAAGRFTSDLLATQGAWWPVLELEAPIV